MKKFIFTKNFGSFLVILFFLCVLLLSHEAHSLEIKCAGFKDGGTIPLKYTGMGLNISPLVFWKDIPEGTKSYVLIVEDPDAPSGIWTHWVVYDIPRAIHILKEGMPRRALLRSGIKQGKNSFRTLGYGGPYPPPGPPHRYIFTIYALDTILRLPPGITRNLVENAMKGHIIEEASITGIFGRD